MFPGNQGGPAWLTALKGAGGAAQAMGKPSPWSQLGGAIGQAGGAYRARRDKKKADQALDEDQPLSDAVNSAVTDPKFHQDPTATPPDLTPPASPDGSQIVTQPTLALLQNESVTPLDPQYRNRAKVRPSTFG
jgi:hypothetical protein